MATTIGRRTWLQTLLRWGFALSLCYLALALLLLVLADFERPWASRVLWFIDGPYEDFANALVPNLERPLQWLFDHTGLPFGPTAEAAGIALVVAVGIAFYFFVGAFFGLLGRATRGWMLKPMPADEVRSPRN